MNHDLLLAYLSELGEGDWTQLRKATDWLAPERYPDESAWVVAGNLAALGHMEIHWGSEVRWCAAPPVITMIPRSGGRAFLTGARSRSFDGVVPSDGSNPGRLQSVVDELELWVDRVPQTGGPTTNYLACASHEDAECLASKLGVAFTYSVSRQLAAVLPGLEKYLAFWTEGNLPLNVEVAKFDVQSLVWRSTDNSADLGLYRAKHWEKTVFAVHGPRVHQWRLVDRDHAAFEVMRWEGRNAIAYDELELELQVPVHTPLPALQARAAVLCSGRLPTGPVRRKELGDGVQVMVYKNVDRFVADRIASSLNQELVIAQ